MWIGYIEDNILWEYTHGHRWGIWRFGYLLGTVSGHFMTMLFRVRMAIASSNLKLKCYSYEGYHAAVVNYRHAVEYNQGTHSSSSACMSISHAINRRVAFAGLTAAVTSLVYGISYSPLIALYPGSVISSRDEERLPLQSQPDYCLGGQRSYSILAVKLAVILKYSNIYYNIIEYTIHTMRHKVHTINACS